MSRIVGIVAVVAVVAVGAMVAGQRSEPIVEVYKSPTCGCCALWVQHLEEQGFQTRVTEVADIAAVKAEHGVPGRLQSCHTAVVDGYVIEGHVPTTDLRRLLSERPAVRGLAVPGMPIGSPGMEVGTTMQPYDVLSFNGDGQTSIFASYSR